VIQKHSERVYRVFAIGFAPGFAYLGEVAPELSMPRLATPRAKVPAGTLGIADTQTALYPIVSPGGWNLIGRTPLTLFDQTRDRPSLLEAGQVVRFRPIGQQEYLDLGGQLDG
jgi:KipI family sensor histidine kinase inhibitor